MHEGEQKETGGETWGCLEEPAKVKLSPWAGAGVGQALDQRHLVTLSSGAVDVYGHVSSAVTRACKDGLGLALPRGTGW